MPLGLNLENQRRSHHNRDHNPWDSLVCPERERALDVSVSTSVDLSFPNLTLRDIVSGTFTWGCPVNRLGSILDQQGENRAHA